MPKLLAVMAVLVASIGATHAVADSPARPPAGLPNCPGTVVWVTYGTTLTCDVNPPQVLNERYIPSAWTLAQAHTYCADKGAVGAYTRYSGVANVCPDIDY